jgi:hypothetical protein
MKTKRSRRTAMYMVNNKPRPIAYAEEMKIWNVPDRSPERVPKLLKRLQRVWEKHPRFRLGQLLLNALGSEDGGKYNKNLADRVYYIEDADLLAVIEQVFGTDKVANFADGLYGKQGVYKK